MSAKRTPRLTPKEEAFILGYIETGNASEAYRRSHPASKNWKPQTVHVKASQLLAKDKVQIRLHELRSKVAEKAVLDRAWVIERLMRNALIAMGEERITIVVKPKDKAETVTLEVTDRDAGAANKALELLGKTPEVALFAPERAEVALNLDPMNADLDAARRVAYMLGRGLERLKAQQRGHDGTQTLQ